MHAANHRPSGGSLALDRRAWLVSWYGEMARNVEAYSRLSPERGTNLHQEGDSRRYAFQARIAAPKATYEGHHSAEKPLRGVCSDLAISEESSAPALPGATESNKPHLERGGESAVAGRSMIAPCQLSKRDDSRLDACSRRSTTKPCSAASRRQRGLDTRTSTVRRRSARNSCHKWSK